MPGRFWLELQHECCRNVLREQNLLCPQLCGVQGFRYEGDSALHIEERDTLTLIKVLGEIGVTKHDRILRLVEFNITCASSISATFFFYVLKS